MGKRVGARCAALAVALVMTCWCMAVPAWADDALGDVDTPNAAGAQSAAASQGAAAHPAASTAQGAVDTGGVALSADSASALIEGCPFAVDSFSRAQVGSNRSVDGVYRGYSYFVGSSAGSVSLVATDSAVVVYVPAASAQELGFDVGNADDRADMQRYLMALDTLNANGGVTIDSSATWYFTTEPTITVGNLVFGFDQELKNGQYYDTVMGTDGSDIADTANPLYDKPTHACFARLVAADAVGIVAQPSWWQSMAEFLSRIDYSPLWVTLKTTGTAIIFIFILGLAAAYFSLHVSPRVRDIADSIFTIPMVLPPTVCGFLLLLLLGRNTGLGRWFIDIGFPLIFSWPATVIAAVVVAFPLMYRSARGAFEGLDPNMMDAAKTLGWSNARIFFKLMLPLSWSNIASGTVLAFARALGEFGATLFLAGNYLGITRTIPIAIYFEWMNGNTDVAMFWTVIIVIFSFVVILFINFWSRRTTRYRKGAIEE